MQSLSSTTGYCWTKSAVSTLVSLVSCAGGSPGLDRRGLEGEKVTQSWGKFQCCLALSAGISGVLDKVPVKIKGKVYP